MLYGVELDFPSRLEVALLALPFILAFLACIGFFILLVTRSRNGKRPTYKSNPQERMGTTSRKNNGPEQ